MEMKNQKMGGWLKEMSDFRKIVGDYSMQYPALDPTAPWYEFLSYCRCCESLNRPVRIGGFMRYRAYLKEIGIL
jgi:hypothetical protein